jgi:hypothetical protein
MQSTRHRPPIFINNTNTNTNTIHNRVIIFRILVPFVLPSLAATTASIDRFSRGGLPITTSEILAPTKDKNTPLTRGVSLSTSLSLPPLSPLALACALAAAAADPEINAGWLVLIYAA